MRAHLSWAIVFVLIVLIAGTSISRRARIGNSKRETLAKTQPPEIVEIKPTLSEITNAAVSFFDKAGNPLVGFVEKGTNGIVLFSAPSGASAVGDVVSPITRDKVETYVRMLEARAAEEKRIEETKIAKARQDQLIDEIRKREEEEARKRVGESNAVVLAKAEQERRRVQESNDVAKAQAELKAYRDRYITINSSFERAVIIVDEANKQNMPLSSAVADLLRRTGSKTTISLFKPAFVTDGLFNQAFEGQGDALQRLPIKDGARSILFGRQTVSYTSNPQLSDVISASMKLDLNAVATDGLRAVASQSIQAVGAGFTKDEARLAAESRISAQLTNGILAKIEQALFKP